MPEPSHPANSTADQLHQELVKVTAQRDEAYLWHTLAREALAAAGAPDKSSPEAIAALAAQRDEANSRLASVRTIAEARAADIRRLREELAAANLRAEEGQRAAATLAKIDAALDGYAVAPGDTADRVAQLIAADCKIDDLEKTVEILTAERDTARFVAADVARLLVKTNEVSTAISTVLREHLCNNR